VGVSDSQRFEEFKLMASRVRFLTTVVFGVAVSWLTAGPAHAVTIDMVTVGNSGNSNNDVRATFFL
jgi:hypothetical protein